MACGFRSLDGGDQYPQLQSQPTCSTTKPVAFALRSNYAYDGNLDDDYPFQGNAISFKTQEFFHIKEVYDKNWWIGRLVKEGSDLCYIPSPTKLEIMRMVDQSSSSTKNSVSSNLDGSPTAGGGRTSALTVPPVKYKRNIFFKKEEIPLTPYDVVPLMRPIVIVGPSLKGYEVTDMMQKALFNFLKLRFEGRIIITRVVDDISLAKKSLFNDPSKISTIGNKPGSRSHTIACVKEQVERIFEFARTMQLLVLDCDTINYPSQLVKTTIAPTMVYIKMKPEVLYKLIKLRGKSQTRHLNVQMIASEKLAQCPSKMFDVILDENRLEDACDHIAGFMESYWRATRPRQILDSSEQPPYTIKRSPEIDLSMLIPKTNVCTSLSEYNPMARRSSGTHNEYDDYEPDVQQRMKNMSLSVIKYKTHNQNQQPHVVDNVYHDHLLRQSLHSYHSQLQQDLRSHDGLLHQNRVMQLRGQEHEPYNYEYQQRQDQRYPHQFQHENYDGQRQQRRERYVSFHRSVLNRDDE